MIAKQAGKARKVFLKHIQPVIEKMARVVKVGSNTALANSAIVAKARRMRKTAVDGFTLKEICEIIHPKIIGELEQSKCIHGIEARLPYVREGDVFFDINSESMIGADNAETLNECAAVVVRDSADLPSIDAPVLVVDNPIGAYADVCRWVLNDLSGMKIIAVGGSSGKTSMKDTIYGVLAKCVPCQKSYANSNNIFGFGKQLSRIRHGRKAFVQEVGLMGDGRGDLTKAFAKLLRPSFAILTNIGDNHIEQYHDRDSIYEIKKSLADCVQDGGFVFVNADDDLLRRYKNDAAHVIRYTIDEDFSDEIELRASNIIHSSSGLTFDICFMGSWARSVKSNLIGSHNVYNLIVAYAITVLMGFEKHDAIDAIRGFKLQYPTRQNVRNICGATHYIDCFNSSPESIEYALEAAMDLPLGDSGKRVAILGDIAQLGGRTDDLHEKIGDIVKLSRFDVVFFFGESVSKAYEVVRGSDTLHAALFANRMELEHALQGLIQPGDVVVWKASHAMHLEKTIDHLYGTDFYSLYPDEDVKGEGMVVERKQMRFKLFSDHAKLMRSFCKDDEIEIPEAVNGVPVASIANSAFKGCPAKVVRFPSGLRYVGERAFAGCKSLREIHFCDQVRFIDRDAFSGCRSLLSARFPPHASMFLKALSRVAVLCGER